MTADTDFPEYDAYENNQCLLNDKYRFVCQIQKGSFGKVSLAIDTKTNTKVALKAMYKTPDVEHMARHEIKVLKKLGHGNENICQLLDSFDTKNFVVLVLEYCANGDLYDVIHSVNSSPSAVDVWYLAKGMYNGLTYSHSLGIYHRDIKPENILFTDQGHVKICDWGLATYTQHSSVFNVGTEKYMAPECFLHTPISSNPNVVVESYDCKAADYWSYAVTLLTAIFGTCPFKPVTANCGEVWGSADDFKLKKKSVKKSLESDYNFKNFVFYNKPEVLYDIYPDMNKNCFDIFMNLLKVGGTEDDLQSYQARNSSRDLDKFIRDLEANWKYGLTVWEEDELYVRDEDSEQVDTELVHNDSVFDMDDFVQESEPEKKSTEKEQKAAFESTSSETYSDRGGSSVEAKSSGIPVPSLVESSYQPKSWCDWEEELSEAEFNEFFNSLSFRNTSPLKAAKDEKAKIRIIDKEIHETENWTSF